VSTSSLIFALIAVLFLVTFIVACLAVGFLLQAIGISGLLYRYAEDRYPEALAPPVVPTGVREPRAKSTPEKPLADLAHYDEDEELEDEVDPQWLSANH
jgi:hypothetical protein